MAGEGVERRTFSYLMFLGLLGSEQPLPLSDITNQRNLTLKYSHDLFQMRQKKYPRNIRDPAFCVCRCKTDENIGDFSFGPEIQMPELSWSEPTLFLGRGKMM